MNNQDRISDQPLIDKIESFLNESNSLIITDSTTAEVQKLIEMVRDYDQRTQPQLPPFPSIANIPQSVSIPAIANIKAKQGGKQGYTWTELKQSLHLTLTPTAIHWLNQRAAETGIHRNDLLEFWARGLQPEKLSEAHNIKASRTRRKKSSTPQRSRIAFDQPKVSRHFALTDTASHWLDQLASEHEINRNDVFELWARGQITVPAPVPKHPAIAAAQVNPRSCQEGRIGYDFGEPKHSGNIPLTDTAMNWLKALSAQHQINLSDLIHLWAISALPLPSAMTQPETRSTV